MRSSRHHTATLAGIEVLALLVAGLASEAGPAEDDAKPAASNLPGAEYPRVHPDLRVTFRVNAPEAQKVQVIPGGSDNGLGRGPFDMTRDEKGIWTVTTPPAVPGFHYYWLLVDGFACNDPSTQTYFGWNKECSGIEVPDKGVDFYDVKDVPHGEVRARWYHSKVTGTWRRAMVYTPPGYDADPQTATRALPAARRRRGRARLDAAGPGELHPRQPDRREEGQADDRRHGERHGGFEGRARPIGSRAGRPGE